MHFLSGVKGTTEVAKTYCTHVLVHCCLSKMAKSLQTTFSNAFSWQNMRISLFNFHQISVLSGPIDKEDGICSGYDLTPDIQQAISLTNDDSGHWRKYASLGLDEFTLSMRICFKKHRNIHVFSTVFPYSDGTKFEILPRRRQWPTCFTSCQYHGYHATLVSIVLADFSGNIPVSAPAGINLQVQLRVFKFRVPLWGPYFKRRFRTSS